MLFSRDKDDDDDFFPNPNFNSNLSSIFGTVASGGENNPSLTYTPPKQPRRQNKPTTISAPPSSSNRSSQLLCAKTVQTFKMVAGAYESQGKTGAAVLCFGTGEKVTYQILLYRGKQDQLCNTRILRELRFHIQPKNYCTFYDKQNVIWSIFFDSPADMAEFNLEVAKCRWKAEQSSSPILIQDLWCPAPSGEGSKTTAAAGDSVELTYTISIIDNTSEEAGESQRVVVEVEASGWKQALVGVQLNSQRVIILQPFMLGDLNPKEAVYKSPVVVKFTVLQVSKASQPEPAPIQLPEVNQSQVRELPKPEPTLPDISDPKTTEIAQSPKSTKADLINRMARMGQALPFKKAVPITSDSDETEEELKSPMPRLSKVVPKPRARVQHGTLPPATCEGGGGVEPSLLTTGIQPYMVGNLYPVPQVSSPLDSHFNMFLSEVRTTNSELRMGITRLTDKVDNLQTKVEESQKAPASRDVLTVFEKLMEGEQQLKEQLQQVMTTLQNTHLASQIRASAESQAQSAAEATQAAVELPSIKHCQQCAEVHQHGLALSEQLNKLQKENEFLQISLIAQRDALSNAKIADKDQLSQIETLQRELSEEHKHVCELNDSLETLQRVKEVIEGDLQAANKQIADLQSTLQEKQICIDKLEQALKDSEATKLEEVRRNLQEVLDPKPLVGDHIKKILNAVYRLVKVQFDPTSKYDATFIHSVFAETIKAVTLEYLQNGVLKGSGRATPAVSNQSVPEGQAKLEEIKTSYMDREQRTGADIDCKPSTVASSVSLSSEHSSDGSSISQTNHTIENKVVPDKPHTENKSDCLKEKDHPADNSTSVDLPSSVINTTDDSSDDVLRPQPPPPPLFEDEEIDDDWLNS